MGYEQSYRGRQCGFNEKHQSTKAQRATPSSSLVLHTPWVHNARSSPWAASITPECEGTVIFWNKIKTIDDSGRSACSARRRTKALSQCSENKSSTNKLLLSSQHSGPSASPDMHPTLTLHVIRTGSNYRDISVEIKHTPRTGPYRKPMLMVLGVSEGLGGFSWTR